MDSQITPEEIINVVDHKLDDYDNQYIIGETFDGFIEVEIPIEIIEQWAESENKLTREFDNGKEIDNEQIKFMEWWCSDKTIDYLSLIRFAVERHPKTIKSII